MSLIGYALLLSLAADPLPPGDHRREFELAGLQRSYILHVPPKYDATKPTPLVLIWHGAGTNAAVMLAFTGFNDTADANNFLVAYPNGTGTLGMYTLNSGGLPARMMVGKPDDVAFARKVIDDAATIMNVDAKRVFSTGLSNGGMMSHRLGAELSDRIAAIAPVAGTLAVPECKPTRSVSVMHFHGTDDKIVPYAGPGTAARKALAFRSVDETVKTWANVNGCPSEPKVEELKATIDDGTKIRRTSYAPGKDGAEVVLFTIEGGGHTWPGRPAPETIIGKATKNLDANEEIWKFFAAHPMK